MNLSIELNGKLPKQRRMNIRVFTQVRQNFQESKVLGSQLRIATYRTHRHVNKQNSNLTTSKKTLTSFKSINRKNGGWLPTCFNPDGVNRVQIVKEEMLDYMTKKLQNKFVNINDILEEIFQIGQSINESFYNYGSVQKKIKNLNDQVKKLNSNSCEFYCFCISALILFEYSSLSLTVFYFDKALKSLSSKQMCWFDCRLQIIAYKYVAKVFLQINKLKQAKDMAYMYLRKAWRYQNLDEEMSAYDLLGQIQLQEGNIAMSRYFHWRMCHAIREQKQILHISNQELDKRKKVQFQFTVYQDILIFVKDHQQIVSILSNHFRSQAQEQAKGFINNRKNKQIYIYTHRSPNRILRNHRNLERKLIDEKESNQLHFIRPKDIKKLRKLITQFNSFIFDVKRQWEIDVLKQNGQKDKRTQYDTF